MFIQRILDSKKEINLVKIIKQYHLSIFMKYLQKYSGYIQLYIFYVSKTQDIVFV